MEEKILAKSQSYDVKKLLLVFVVLGLLMSLIWGGIKYTDYKDSYNWDFVEHEHEHDSYCYSYYFRDDFYDDLANNNLQKEKAWCDQLLYENADACAFDRTMSWIHLWILPFPAIALIGVLIYLWLRSYELTVTDKRVYGKVVFGKRVDLPIDSVSATATIGLFKGVSVSTSSGKISFLAIKNASEIFETVNKLLVARQSEKKEIVASVVATTDDADQLQKFKKLLDDGVITQEEFDAKKKQILGL